MASRVCSMSALTSAPSARPSAGRSRRRCRGSARSPAWASRARRAATATPNTQSLSFHGATFTSSTLSFTGYETTDRDRKPLDSLTAADEALLTKYDSPYVSKASAGSIPFVDIGGKWMISGASFDPDVLKGKTHEEIATAMGDPTTDIAKAVDGTANIITAALCTLTKDAPATVCASPGVKAADANLAQCQQARGHSPRGGLVLARRLGPRRRSRGVPDVRALHRLEDAGLLRHRHDQLPEGHDQQLLQGCRSSGAGRARRAGTGPAPSRRSRRRRSAPTSAAWAPVETPSPTQTGRSVTARARSDQRRGRVADRRSHAGDAHRRGGVDEAAAGRRAVRRAARRRGRRDQEDPVEVRWPAGPPRASRRPRPGSGPA